MYSVETGERVDMDVVDGGESGGRVDEYPILPKNLNTINNGGGGGDNGIGVKFPGIISVRREVLVTTST